MSSIARFWVLTRVEISTTLSCRATPPVGFGGFGHLTSQGNYPREIQFGLKINY